MFPQIRLEACCSLEVSAGHAILLIRQSTEFSAEAGIDR
jgi:hypothetical protein